MSTHTNRAESVEVRSLHEEDRKRFQAMTAQAFTLPHYRADLHGLSPAEEVRVLTRDRQIQGALHVELVGQFFGGNAVPSSAISAVQILPEARGKGFGRVLMTEVMEEMRHRGVSLSILYPTI